MAAAGGGSGGRRRVLAGVAAAGSGEAGGGSGERWQRRAATGSGGRGSGGRGRVAVAGVAVAGEAAAGVVVCVVARLIGLKVWEAPAREVWARVEGMSRRGGVCWQQLKQQRGQQQRGSSSVYIYSGHDPPLPPTVGGVHYIFCD